jgi:HPt (histidine-containing phosphotransfer) domain-containing protein
MAEPTIDAAVYEALEQNVGKEFVGELVDTFLADAPRMLDDLRSAFAARDADRFRRAAHSLKSNSNTFGARTLGAMARDLEVNGLDAALEAGPGALDALAHEYSFAAAALKVLRDA